MENYSSSTEYHSMGVTTNKSIGTSTREFEADVEMQQKKSRSLLSDSKLKTYTDFPNDANVNEICKSLSSRNYQILLAVIEIFQVLGYYIYWIYTDIEPDIPFKNVKYFLFLFFAPFLIIYFLPCFKKLVVIVYICLFLIKMSIIRTMTEFALICLFSMLIIVESVTTFILLF